MPTTATIVETDGRVVLTLPGPADLGSLPAWRTALRRLVDEHPGRDRVVDLDAVSVLDDTVLGLLLGATADAGAGGGSLTIVGGRDTILARFRSTGVDQILRIVTDLEGR
jgi:anti-anti-sigma factor